MASQLPVTGVVPLVQMLGEDEDETSRLKKMVETAQQFLLDFAWCLSIKDFYFGDGIGDVVAIFLAQIEPASPDIDGYLWVVVGDLPPAYLVTDDAHTPRLALESYIDVMRTWVACVQDGGNLHEVFPVKVPATDEWAEALESRLNALEEKIIPAWFA